MANLRKNDLPWFVYIRVSSKDQGEKYGPARQVESIRNWMRVNVPEVIVPGLDSCVVSPREVRNSEFIGFDKQSGKTDERDDFQRGVEMARSGKIRGFISLRLDRVARNTVDALLLRTKLKRMGVRLEFATQSFDNTPTGDLMYANFASFAELEGKLILERTAGGRLSRFCEDKLFNGGASIPYGYAYVTAEIAKKHPGAAIGKVIIYEPEAKIVRLIFRMYLDGKTTYQIMNHLNRKGIRTRRGRAWWRETVGAVLQKADRYAGVYTVRLGMAAAKREYAERVKLMGDENAEPLDLSGVTEARLDLPAIIDEETARRAKALLTRNKATGAGRPSQHFPLSKLVYCAACGGRWYFQSKGVGRKRRAHCWRRAYRGLGAGIRCDSSGMSADRLEDAVLDAVKDYLRQPEVAHAAAMQAYRKEHGADAQEVRANSEANLAGLREEQEHFSAILLNPAMKKLHARASTRFSELEIQIQDMERELRRAPVSVIYSEASIVAAFGAKLGVLDKIRTVDDKREFFQSTVQRVDMTEEEAVITGAIAIPQTAAANGRGNWKNRQDRSCNLPASIPFVIRKRIKAA
jgi:DNA invertase Pin-like site-specific DNA recombinase